MMVVCCAAVGVRIDLIASYTTDLCVSWIFSQHYMYERVGRVLFCVPVCVLPDSSVRVVGHRSASRVHKSSRALMCVSVCVFQDGSVRVIDLSDYSVIAHARGPCAASAVTLDRQDRLLVGFEDGGVRFYDVRTGDMLQQITKCHRGSVTVSVCVCARA